MPRNVTTGIYTLPPVYLAVAGTPILVTQHNDPLVDIQDTLNEAWPFDVEGKVLAPDGLVTLPSITFAADLDTGIYRIGANNFGASAAGAKVLDISATGLGVVGTVLNGNGTVSLPAYSYTSDPDSGWYRIGANNLGAAVNGAKVLDVSTTGLSVVGTMLSGDGTVSSPSVGFYSDTDNGLYRIGANNWGAAAAGAKVLDVSATGLGVVGTILNGDGTVSLPAFSFTSDPDTGIYRIGANNAGFAANGAKVLDVSTTGLGVTGTTLSGDGTVSLPGIGFTADTNTGIYRIGADNIGVAANGAKVLDVATTGLAVTGTLSATGLVSANAVTTGSTPGLSVTNTSAGANGATAELYHNSATPAATDSVVQYLMYGNSSAATKRLISSFVVRFDDTTDGSEDAAVIFNAIKAGTLTRYLALGSNAANTATPDAIGLSLGQLSFPATQNPSSDANTLDDYEEGTWTPSLGGNTTYTTQTGRYTKIGNQVSISGRLTINAIGTGSTSTITGVPFAAGATAPLNVGYWSTVVSASVWIGGYILSGTTTITMTGATAATAGTTDSFGTFKNGTDIVFSAIYTV